MHYRRFRGVGKPANADKGLQLGHTAGAIQWQSWTRIPGACASLTLHSAKQSATNSFSFIEPMMALRVRELPAGDWLYEMKQRCTMGCRRSGVPPAPSSTCQERRPGRWGQGITPAVFKHCAWVEPVLIAQIKFTEWTSDDQLRQPVLLGLRSDKQAKEVVRE
jgi:ATP-dependent DNA ligase